MGKKILTENDIEQSYNPTSEMPQSGKAVAQAIANIENSGGGGSGENGATFIPNVSTEGVISWTNDKGLSNPTPVNIKGSQGIQGEKGEQGIQGIQGAKGDKGDKGADGTDGYTPIKGVDYFDDTDKAEIVASVIETLGGNPVFGYVDKNNNIIVSGNLPDGSYSVKYEMEGGSTVDIGNLVLDTNTYYSVSNRLTNCTNSNSASEVVGGESYSATITANSGYELKSLTVTMGGQSVSVSGGTIEIASVTGDIVITAVAEEVKAEAKNWIKEVGYTEDTRLSLSSGGTTSASGYECTGFIPVKYGDVIRIKNIDITAENATNLVTYDGDKNQIKSAGNNYGGQLAVLFATGVCTLNSNALSGLTNSLAYIRIGSKSITADSILTVNEEIT